jgi:hypothetical protein
MRFITTKHGLLTAFDKDADDFLRRQTSGEPIEMVALHPRDMVFHRYVFGVMDVLAKALHTTPELVRAELLRATGNFLPLGNLFDQTPVIAVSSMSRVAMNDRELHEFWNEAKEVIQHSLMKKIKAPAERNHLAELLQLEPAA